MSCSILQFMTSSLLYRSGCREFSNTTYLCFLLELNDNNFSSCILGDWFSGTNFFAGDTREGSPHSCDCAFLATSISSGCCCLLCIAKAARAAMVYTTSFWIKWCPSFGLLLEIRWLLWVSSSWFTVSSPFFGVVPFSTLYIWFSVGHTIHHRPTTMNINYYGPHNQSWA